MAAALGVVGFILVQDPDLRRWESRTPLPSCGSVVLDQGQSLRRDAVSEVDCLRRAMELGRGAELRVQRPTTEGDPLVMYYRVTPAGTTELYEDATKDAFGGGWHFAECAKPSSVLEPAC